MEWDEGVARYTERELAALAADPDAYAPTAPFAELFPSASYTGIWKETYATYLNPVRFIGEGVQGRAKFYFMGMGKAYLLDRLLPDWKMRYFDAGLDDLIAMAVSAPACAAQP